MDLFQFTLVHNVVVTIIRYNIADFLTKLCVKSLPHFSWWICEEGTMVWAVFLSCCKVEVLGQHNGVILHRHDFTLTECKWSLLVIFKQSVTVLSAPFCVVCKLFQAVLLRFGVQMGLQ